MINGNLATHRRIGRLIDIVDTAHNRRHSLVQLNDDLICQTTNSGDDTDTGGGNNLTAVVHNTCLHNGYVRLG